MSLLFPRGEKRGVGGGTRRRFEHRHSVYIYQNFFAFDRAIAIKMCSCSCPGLGRLPSSLYSFFFFFSLVECFFADLCLSYVTQQFSFQHKQDFDVTKDPNKCICFCLGLLSTLMHVILKYAATHPPGGANEVWAKSFQPSDEGNIFSFFLWALWKATRLRNSLITLESDKKPLWEPLWLCLKECTSDVSKRYYDKSSCL